MAYPNGPIRPQYQGPSQSIVSSSDRLMSEPRPKYGRYRNASAALVIPPASNKSIIRGQR